MKHKRGERGAVSVFLVIILVPCLLASSIFVDAGRVYLSKGMAQASGELALNTLMTNYDYDLNDWYGMVASCQTIDQFYDISAQYFIRTMKSQNLSDDEMVLLSQQFAGAVGDDSIYDYLKVEETSDTTVKAVEGANLANTTLIKNEVVEFMKYRGPIVVAEEVIDKLKSDSTSESVAEASKNEPLVDSKKEFYETEAELTRKAYNTYHYLFENYTKKDYTNDKLQAEIDKLEDAKKTYAEIHSLMITNLYNTENLQQFNRPTVDLGYKTYTYDTEGCYSRIEKEVDQDATTSANEEKRRQYEEKKAKGETVGDYRDEVIIYKDVYYIDGKQMNQNFSNVRNAIDAFEEVKNNLVQDIDSHVPYNSGTTNDIQYWKKASDIFNGVTGTNYRNEYLSKAREMLDAYAKMKAMMDCSKGNDLPGDYENTFSNLRDRVESLQSSYLTAGYGGSDGYLTIVNRLESISAANMANINPNTVKLSSGEQLNTALARISGDMTKVRKQLQEYVDALTVVIKGKGLFGRNKVVSLDKLAALAAQYRIDLNEWKGYANSVGTELAGEDQTEIEELHDTLADEINEAAVAELKTRLLNICSQLQGFIDVMDSMTYGGKKISKISNYSTLKSKASSQVSKDSIGLNNAELTSYADSTFAQLFQPTGTEAIYQLNKTDAYNLSLHVDYNPPSVNVPALYVYLYGKFKDSDGGAADKIEKEMDGATSDSNKYLDDEKKKTRYHYTGTSNITPSFSEGQTFQLLSDGLGAIGSLVDNLLKGKVENIRDNLFLTVYAKEMFSYATYDNEGKYKILADRKYEVTSLNKGNYKTTYNDAKEEWLDESPKISRNKSLTNKMINTDHNAAMGAELEYMLYGKSENSENVKSAYNDIYAVRYSLNLVSAFQNFWTRSSVSGRIINDVADTLSLATGEIIPAPAVKVVILPILTLFETGNDLNRLEAGFPVELYKKNEDYWHYTLDSKEGGITGIMNKITELSQGFQNPREEGIFYSDYLTLFILLGFQGSKSEDMTKRMAEVIQANLQKLTEDSSYSMEKAYVYFEVESELKVDPLLMTLPIFTQYNDAYDSSKTDWCTYKTKVIRGY